MSITTSRTLSSEMPHSPETGRRIAREHGRSEFTNDVDTITPTVSAWDQHFALLSSTPDGELQLRARVRSLWANGGVFADERNCSTGEQGAAASESLSYDFGAPALLKELERRLALAGEREIRLPPCATTARLGS